MTPPSGAPRTAIRSPAGLCAVHRLDEECEHRLERSGVGGVDAQQEVATAKIWVECRVALEFRKRDQLGKLW